MRALHLIVAAAMVAPAAAAAQAHRPLLPIDFANSAEFRWLSKPVQASRVLDDMTEPSAWVASGTARMSFPAATALDGMHVLRVDMQLFRGTPAPTRSKLSTVNLRRAVANEDWSAYNRISIWMRADVAGVPTIPIGIVLHNDGAVKVPDRYDRDGNHWVTLAGDGWHQVVWEIDPLARDRVTGIEFGYFLNKMFADSTDHVGFEIGRIELQRVEPEGHTGWNVVPGRIAFSNTGYQAGASKTAIASGLDAREFELVRVDDNALGIVVLRRPLRAVHAMHGDFQEMDFSDVNVPGSYVVRAGGTTTRPFRIDRDVWTGTVWKALNFFYGNRCGYAVPGVHGVDHLDWFGAHGDQRITLSGGWHDAGDLSQGVINTGEVTYSMFALAERVLARGDDPELAERLLEEAKWGLDWVLRVRFPGGYRIGFASQNVWTDNVTGTADDRVVEAKNNPNANYIAAAAEAIAARVLKTRDPALAARALATAEEDWGAAIDGVEGPSTWHTPAFAATRMELAGIGATASIELYRATGKKVYADKAAELARVITASQQVRRVGSAFPLAGFFYTGPERDTLFHQFHRAADQAPIVALAQLVEVLPDHPDWMTWYSTVARYAEYQKRTATTTAPYGVLPAYVYRISDTLTVPDSGGRYGATRGAYGAQVRTGMPMGEGWYLRALPVSFARRGNYGVLLSQAKALSAASRLRGDSAGLDLAQRQAQWVVGRNPFVRSTMYGEGYDWEQQYSVSSGDLVGALPVGMQSSGDSDLPYWPTQNTYVYKEVWVHSTGRWLWLIEDLLAAGASDRTPPGRFALDATPLPNGAIRISLVTRNGSAHTYSLRADNLRGAMAAKRANVAAGKAATIEWTLRPVDRLAGWTVVAIEDGDVTRRRELTAP